MQRGLKWPRPFSVTWPSASTLSFTTSKADRIRWRGKWRSGAGRLTSFGESPMRFLFCVISLHVPTIALGADDKPVPIGSSAGNLTFKDTRFLNRSLDDFKNRRAFVLAFVESGCPLARRYLPVLNRLETDYRGKGVQFL